MNISKQVVEQLKNLAAGEPRQAETFILNSVQQPGYIVGVPTEVDGLNIILTLEDYDRYSARLQTLEVSDHSFSADGQNIEDYLRRCAGSITDRLTYLEEPLTILEFDAGENTAQLRSEPAHQGEDEVIYWEALLSARPGLRAKLTRYRWTPHHPHREVLAYPATFETLGRLAQDIALSLRFTL